MNNCKSVKQENKSENLFFAIKNLSFIEGNKIILKNINLEIFKEEILTIIGPNGAGKTTFLKLLLGLIKPTKGKIKILGNLKIGYIPQKINITNLMPVSVERFLKFSPNFNLKDFYYFVEILRIKSLLKSDIYNLSGGELRRVLFLRALLNNPNLLVLDEPAQGVDISGQSELYKIISFVSKTKKCTTILVSHDLHLVMSTTDRVICLNKHICCSGYPESIHKHPEFISLYKHHHDHIHNVIGDEILKK